MPKRTRVQPISRDKVSKRFDRLRGLSCFQDVHQRLISGWPVHRTAKLLQEVYGEYKDITLDSLETLLTEYRKTIPPTEFIRENIPEVALQAIDKLNEGLDELEELRRLYRLQWARIETDVTIENRVKKLLPTTRGEIETARKLLETSAQLRIELGRLSTGNSGPDHHAALLTDVQTSFGTEAVRDVLARPEARQKVLAVAKLLFGVSGALGVDANELMRTESGRTIDTVGTTEEAPEPEDIPPEGSLDASLGAESAEETEEPHLAAPLGATPREDDAIFDEGDLL